ncbi:MAG: hypothetical protein FWF03_01610 [Defluviitaleaceae bacterium]|nr:hypothetical protein [Defluviitaleaceae bacterium]
MKFKKVIATLTAAAMIITAAACSGGDTPAAPTAAPTPTSAPVETDDIASDAQVSIEDDDIASDEFDDIAADEERLPDNILLTLDPDLETNVFYDQAMMRLNGIDDVEEEEARYNLSNMVVNIDSDFYFTPPSSLFIGNSVIESEWIQYEICSAFTEGGGAGFYWFEFYARSMMPEPGVIGNAFGGATGGGWWWYQGNRMQNSNSEWVRYVDLCNIGYLGTMTEGWGYMAVGGNATWIDDIKMYRLHLTDDDFLIAIRGEQFESDGSDNRYLAAEGRLRWKRDPFRTVDKCYHVPDGKIVYDVKDMLIENGMGEYYASTRVCSGDMNEREPLDAELYFIIEDDGGEHKYSKPFTMTNTDVVHYEMYFMDYADLFNLQWAGTLKSAKLVIESEFNQDFHIAEIQFIKRPF